MVLAEGGTAGPPTGHMIVAARSKTIEGPWENSPYNPILRTQSADERWWSKGHGTLVEDRAGKLVDGLSRLRERLLHARPADAARADRVDRRRLVPRARRRSGEADRQAGRRAAGRTALRSRTISRPAEMGIQWSFYAGDDADRERYRYENDALVLKAKGSGPADSSPLWFVNGDHAYEMEVEIDADPGASAGLLLFYSRRLYAGLGFSAQKLRHAQLRPGSAAGQAAAPRPASATPPPQRSAHRHDRLQRRRQDVGALRPRRSRCRATTTTSPTSS